MAGSEDKTKKQGDSAEVRVDDGPIDFARRFTSSQMFDKVFREGMGLVEETASYLDGPGREDARELDRASSLAYATESMRLTTRLMQLASWLLLQRAVRDGEMTQAQVHDEKYRIKLDQLATPDPVSDSETLPEALKALIVRSIALHKRIVRIDGQLRGETEKPQAANAVTDQMDKIRAAFAAD